MNLVHFHSVTENPDGTITVVFTPRDHVKTNRVTGDKRTTTTAAKCRENVTELMEDAVIRLTVSLRRISIDKPLVRALRSAYHQFKREPFPMLDVERVIMGQHYSKFSRLEKFGLIAHPSNDEGLWRVTQEGVDFLAGETTVCERVWLLGGNYAHDDPDSEYLLASDIEAKE